MQYSNLFGTVTAAKSAMLLDTLVNTPTLM
jgi:hypothetical protein